MKNQKIISINIDEDVYQKLIDVGLTKCINDILRENLFDDFSDKSKMIYEVDDHFQEGSEKDMCDICKISSKKIKLHSFGTKKLCRNCFLIMPNDEIQKYIPKNKT
jgi:hypothetical protein